MTIPLANKEAEQCAALDTLSKSSGSTGKIKFKGCAKSKKIIFPKNRLLL